jgi:hypothetical protein
MKLCRVLFFFAAWCVAQTSGTAASTPLELKWTELAPIISGNGVEVMLQDGMTISGEAIAVREDTLILDVKKSSGGKPYSKGNAAIPRNAISLIKVQRSRGAWGRTMGTVVGVVAGLGAGGYAASRSNSGGAAVATLVAIASGLAVTGYYAGRGLDRRLTLIRIVP